MTSRPRSPFFFQSHAPSKSQVFDVQVLTDNHCEDVVEFLRQRQGPTSFGRICEDKWFVANEQRLVVLTSKKLLLKIVELLTERQAQH